MKKGCSYLLAFGPVIVGGLILLSGLCSFDIKVIGIGIVIALVGGFLGNLVGEAFLGDKTDTELPPYEFRD